MSDTVGFRIRGIAPSDLASYPDSAKKIYWGFVLEAALRVKDYELSKGWDKNGNTHALKPSTIKNRKSEVGPTYKNAPRLTPSYARSRTRALLMGRAHTNSAELYWGFDSVIGDSWAVVLHYSAEAGHDVFGVSPAGMAQIRNRAGVLWKRWQGSQIGMTLTPVPTPGAGIPGWLPLEKKEVKKPIRKIMQFGRLDLSRFDLSGGGSSMRAAIAAGLATGFRRLNTVGEKWKPGIQIPRR